MSEKKKKSFYKRWWFWVLAIIIVAGIAGGGEETAQKEEKPKVETEKAKPVTEKQKEKKSESKQANEKKEAQTKKEEQPKNASNEQITPSGGLGDTLDVFEMNYGENTGDQEMARFQNDYILPIFLDGKAWNIKLQFEATNQPKRTMKEALAVAQGFIPNDAQKVKEYDQPEMGRKIIEYKSELLKQRFPDSNPPGTFIVIASYGEAGKENEVFGLTIGVGNNP